MHCIPLYNEQNRILLNIFLYLGIKPILIFEEHVSVLGNAAHSYAIVTRQKAAFIE